MLVHYRASQETLERFQNRHARKSQYSNLKSDPSQFAIRAATVTTVTPLRVGPLSNLKIDSLVTVNLTS